MPHYPLANGTKMTQITAKSRRTSQLRNSTNLSQTLPQGNLILLLISMEREVWHRQVPHDVLVASPIQQPLLLIRTSRKTTKVVMVVTGSCFHLSSPFEGRRVSVIWEFDFQCCIHQNCVIELGYTFRPSVKFQIPEFVRFLL